MITKLQSFQMECLLLLRRNIRWCGNKIVLGIMIISHMDGDLIMSTALHRHDISDKVGSKEKVFDAYFYVDTPFTYPQFP